MQSVVQKLGRFDSGAEWVQLDGKRYFWGKDVSDRPSSGQKIEFEYREFGEDRGRGKPRSITKWRPVMDAAGKLETGPTITDADILRSVSNVVGSACAAGTIKDPVELEKWFCAAWAGFTRRQKSANGADPEFNDEMPNEFYGDSNAPSNRDPNDPGW